MSRRILQPPLTGQALVKLKNGSTYEGYAVYDGRVVTVNGRLRVVSSTGVSYRPLRRRTINLALVQEIVWE